MIPSPPRPPVLALLDLAARVYGEVMVERMRARGIDQSYAQSRLLGVIPRRGIRLTDLADRLGTTKQAAGQLVDELVAGGYLERRPDPTDGRAKLIDFAGGEDVLLAYDALVEVEAEMARHIGEDGVETLRALLLALRPLTDAASDEAGSPTPRGPAASTWSRDAVARRRD